MTLSNVFEKAIKEHIKQDEFFAPLNGVKVIACEYTETIQCHLPGNYTGVDNPMLTKYEVTCSYKAKKWENNRVKFQINMYSDGSDIGVYFDGTYYEG